MPRTSAARTCTNKDFQSADRPAAAGTEIAEFAMTGMVYAPISTVRIVGSYSIKQPTCQISKSLIGVF
jgi:hypothetical protein